MIRAQKKQTLHILVLASVWINCKNCILGSRTHPFFGAPLGSRCLFGTTGPEKKSHMALEYFLLTLCNCLILLDYWIQVCCVPGWTDSICLRTYNCGLKVQIQNRVFNVHSAFVHSTGTPTVQSLLWSCSQGFFDVLTICLWQCTRLLYLIFQQRQDCFYCFALISPCLPWIPLSL